MTRTLLAALTALALLPTAAVAAGPQDIKVQSTKQISPRLVEYTLTTPALAAPTIVRVLLPADYAAQPAKRFPVLYLLNGCCDYDVNGAQAWTTHGEAEAATKDLDVIVVMPDGGKGGFYTDWYNNGAGGPPEYETYHIGELVPWIDQTFRTRAARGGRAIAGLSMGGFGAMSYAARHPDMFVAAAAFSGAVDITDPQFGNEDALNAQDGGFPTDVFGDPATQKIRRRAHNPVDLAANLQGLALTLRTGNGLPGGQFGGGPDPVEYAVHQQMTTLNRVFNGLEYPHTWLDYGPGAHAWGYWADDLKKTLPQIIDAFAQPPAVPALITYTSVAPTWRQYGWRVALKRPVLEFSTLSSAGRGGFVLRGSGKAAVTTPGVYRRGARATVAITDQAGSRTVTAIVGPHHRLIVRVDLGPADTMQQDTPGATTTVRTATVKITAPRRR